MLAVINKAKGLLPLSMDRGFKAKHMDFKGFRTFRILSFRNFGNLRTSRNLRNSRI